MIIRSQLLLVSLLPGGGEAAHAVPRLPPLTARASREREGRGEERERGLLNYGKLKEILAASTVLLTRTASLK